MDPLQRMDVIRMRDQTASSSENIHPLLSSHIKIHWHIWYIEMFWTCLQLETMLDLCIFLSGFRQDDFSLVKALCRLSWNFILAGSNGLKWKTSYWWFCFLQTWSLSLHKMLIGGLESWRLLVDHCDVFFSSYSDGTHSLQRIHWRASDLMQILHIYSDEKTNSTKSTSMDDLRVSSTFSANFHFGVKYPFKSKILANEMNLKTVCFGVLTQGLEPQTSSKQHKVSVSERERSRSEGQCINMGVKDKEAHRWERDREWDGGMSKAHVSGRGFARRRGGSMWMENEASLCHMQWRHSARLKPRPLPVPFSLTEMLNQSELAMSGWEFPG